MKRLRTGKTVVLLRVRKFIIYLYFYFSAGFNSEKFVSRQRIVLSDLLASCCVLQVILKSGQFQTSRDLILFFVVLVVVGFAFSQEEDARVGQVITYFSL